MRIWRVSRTNTLVVVLGLLSLAAAGQADATIVVDLGQPGVTPFLGDNIGKQVDRSVVFDVNAPFMIDSAGIQFDPLVGGATAIAVDIYLSGMTGSGSQGNPHGPVLATASTVITDVGLAFYDVPIVFTFLAGNRYDVAFRSLDPVNGWGSGINDMAVYSSDFFSGSPAFTVFNVTVLDGACHTVGPAGDVCLNYENTVMPHVRLDEFSVAHVPEPATLLLFGAGLVAMTGRSLARRCRRP
jgi:hypothetical protein